MTKPLTKEQKQRILEFVETDDLKRGKPYAAHILAAAIKLTFPDITHEEASLIRVVQQARNGILKREVENQSGSYDEIIKDIQANQQEASRVFVREQLTPLDSDPLGLGEEENIKRQFLDIPETYSSYVAPLKLDGYGKRLGVVSDIHFPIHDRPAVMAAHAGLKEKNIDCLLLLGDIMDTGNLTRHTIKRTLRYTWREEVEVGRAYIQSLRKLFPNIPIIYQFGNHEIWLQQFLIKHAPQLEGEYVLQDRLQLTEHDIEWVDDQRLMRYGDLFLHHGHILGVGGGVNVAHRLLNKHWVNLLVGHFHTADAKEKRDLNEKTHACWINACLADLHPQYHPHNNSTHGYSIVDLLGNGMFKVTQYKIINGREI